MVQQSEKMRFHASGELVFGVNIFVSDFGVQIDSVKQPIQRDSLGSGHVSHRWTSAFNDHVDHSFIVFKFVQLGFEVRTFCACDHVVHLGQSVTVYFVLVLGLVCVLWASLRPNIDLFARTICRCGNVLEECNTSVTRSQRSRTRIPSMRKPASKQKKNFRLS